MTLWLLRPIENLPEDNNPWEPWYDKAFGFVVRAETESEARALAMTAAGDELRGEFMGRPTSLTHQPWLDADYSTCVELSAEGHAEVILRDLWSA